MKSSKGKWGITFLHYRSNYGHLRIGAEVVMDGWAWGLNLTFWFWILQIWVYYPHITWFRKIACPYNILGQKIDKGIN